MGLHRVRLLACACLLLPAGTRAATWVVDVHGPLASIQAALDLASAGDAIVVRPGTYYERLTLTDGVALAAEVAGTVTVDAESEGPVVTAIRIGSTTAVQGIRFTHGSSPTGGALYGVASNLAFTNCSFEASTAVLGGGVFLRDGSRPTFTGCTFRDNLASVGGGLYLDFAAATFQSCTVYRNEASDGAGLAASNAAEAPVNFVAFYENRARQGSIVACNLASPRFTNCTFAGNAATEACIALRGSIARIERSILAWNSGAALACSGFSGPWIGCNIVFGNGDDGVCAGDQGTNLAVDPLFCDPGAGEYGLAVNSPAVAAAGCGALGALPVQCTARGAETAVVDAGWGHVKALFR